MAGGGGGDCRYTGGWEAARHPVLYDNFYLVQYLLDIKGQIYTSGNCRPVNMAITSKLMLDAIRGGWPSIFRFS